jgi:hypothetical protein
VWLYPGEPARAVNLASAVYGALAVGLTAWLTSRLAESTLAGVAAGMFLGSSYTFWSQAITAEVYTLHLLVVSAAIAALLAWAEDPTVGRLALFYAAYALGFGNHLSMVLLCPAFAAFLLITRRAGRADPLRPQMLALAVAIACLGALQYAWNFRGLWTELQPPESIGEAFDKFWFDVTKADWRETLVMTVSEAGLQTRREMYWFDLRQQFGAPGVFLAGAGVLYVTFHWPARALLLTLLYAASLAFAWTYNVGDAYIFFLPSHYVVAICGGAGAAALVWGLSRVTRRGVATTLGVLVLAYPAWRAYDTFPAVDRSWDDRAVKLLDDFTTVDGATVFGTDSNWQVQNAIEYFMRERRPGVPWFVTEELEWLKWPGGRQRFVDFVSANTSVGRDVVVTSRVYESVLSAASRPHTPDATRFSDAVGRVSGGAPYVLSVLLPDREYPLNTLDLARAWKHLAPATAVPELRHYVVLVGKAGERPVLIHSSDRPFRIGVNIDQLNVDVRMESWLPTDTIRRAGFGHVVVDGRHELTLERGISFKTLEVDGAPIYESGLFAPLSRIILAGSQ